MASETILSATYLPPKSFPVFRMVQTVRKEALAYRKWALDHDFEFLRSHIRCSAMRILAPDGRARAGCIATKTIFPPLGANLMVPDLRRVFLGPVGEGMKVINLPFFIRSLM